ncbi:MAG: hypothetical protein EHM57_07425 [Actinobacteria bacterium]|nr:MAG: hypothetical protein EHM57_07425 [Actinomycetota bacterium]
MYTFAVILLLGLAVMAVVMLFDRFLRIADEIMMAVAILLGIGTAWLADFNMFAEWGFLLREEWIGITLTGVILGGVAYLMHELVGLIAGVHRRFVDEAVEFEKVHDLRRAA